MALPLNFAGKHCAVVGGTGVIGAAIAKAFAHEGAAVTVLGRRALEVRDELEPELPPCEPVGEMPPAHRFIKLDAGNLQEIKNTFAPTYLASRCKYTSDPALPRASDVRPPDARRPSAPGPSSSLTVMPVFQPRRRGVCRRLGQLRRRRPHVALEADRRLEHRKRRRHKPRLGHDHLQVRHDAALRCAPPPTWGPVCPRLTSAKAASSTSPASWPTRAASAPPLTLLPRPVSSASKPPDISSSHRVYATWAVPHMPSLWSPYMYTVCCRALTTRPLAFTRALCLEMAVKSVRVNALLPGWVDSPMWRGECTPSSALPRRRRRRKSAWPWPSLPSFSQDLKPALKEAYIKATPLGRKADPSEVAHAAVFLASNAFANNCVLNLDGGLSAS